MIMKQLFRHTSTLLRTALLLGIELAKKNGAAAEEQKTTDSIDIEIQAEERNDLHG